MNEYKPYGNQPKPLSGLAAATLGLILVSTLPLFAPKLIKSATSLVYRQESPDTYLQLRAIALNGIGERGTDGKSYHTASTSLYPLCSTGELDFQFTVTLHSIFGEDFFANQDHIVVRQRHFDCVEKTSTGNCSNPCLDDTITEYNLELSGISTPTAVYVAQNNDDMRFFPLGREPPNLTHMLYDDFTQKAIVTQQGFIPQQIPLSEIMDANYVVKRELLGFPPMLFTPLNNMNSQ